MSKMSAVSTFKPMLCQSATVEQVANGEFPAWVWRAERKLDGIRAYITRDGIFNRRGEEITHKFPELIPIVATMMNTTALEDIVFDGEIVARTEQFDDVSSRTHLKDKLFIKLMSIQNPVKFVLFDIIGLYQYERERFRYTGIWTLLDTLSEEPYFEFVEVGTTQDMMHKAIEQGWEGIILKRRGSPYEQGKRSNNWRKVKLFKEVQHTFSRYDEHPKGITLRDDDEGRSVNINGVQAEEVAGIIKKQGKVTVDIQYLPQTNSTTWRFPSFRGIVRGGENGKHQHKHKE